MTYELIHNGKLLAIGEGCQLPQPGDTWEGYIVKKGYEWSKDLNSVKIFLKATKDKAGPVVSATEARELSEKIVEYYIEVTERSAIVTERMVKAVQDILTIAVWPPFKINDLKHLNGLPIRDNRPLMAFKMVIDFKHHQYKEWDAREPGVYERYMKMSTILRYNATAASFVDPFLVGAITWLQ